MSVAGANSKSFLIRDLLGDVLRGARDPVGVRDCLGGGPEGRLEDTERKTVKEEETEEDSSGIDFFER